MGKSPQQSSEDRSRESYERSFRVLSEGVELELALDCGHRRVMNRKLVGWDRGVVTCMACWWESLEPMLGRLRGLIASKSPRPDSSVVTVDVPGCDEELILRNSRLAEIGGRSHVRTVDRRERIGTDQLVGQACNYAASVYLSGSKDLYVRSRELANANPYSGDGGCDLPGFPIDVKGSLMRGSGNPADYRLPVRPSERHSNWVYVLALLRSAEPPFVVHLVGWTTDACLPAACSGGVFSGAHVVPSRDLRPVDVLRRRVLARLMENAR